MTIAQSIAAFGLIGLTAGLLLIIAYSKLKVEEDERVEKMTGLLPGANCGACGYASCHAYAEAIAKGEAEITECRAGGPELAKQLGEIMGQDHEGGAGEVKAVVRCGVKDRKKLADYSGPGTCASANLTGGGMACRFGCLGYGDCLPVCPFDAISLNENNLPVIDLNKCTGCGICVKECPRNIITLRPLKNNRIVYVGCSNTQAGKNTRKVCDVGCIACMICEKKGPEGAFKVENGLSEVREQKDEIVVDDIKCPTKCIYESRK